MPLQDIFCLKKQFDKKNIIFGEKSVKAFLDSLEKNGDPEGNPSSRQKIYIQKPREYIAPTDMMKTVTAIVKDGD